jgi:putative transposase
MPSIRIHKELNDQIYFLTLTVKNWYYLFGRHNRFEILANSLQYCQKHKNLKIYAFVLMLNHLHLIASALDLIGTIRDFKTFTSKEIQKNIIATEPNVLQLFQTNKGCHIWQNTNFPELIKSEKFLSQKIEYIHNNPVRKQYVEKPEYWLWSSANPNQRFVEISSVY